MSLLGQKRLMKCLRSVAQRSRDNPMKCTAPLPTYAGHVGILISNNRWNLLTVSVPGSGL